MVGNDVVDLSDPETSRDACHVRFDRRVFTPEEFEGFSADHSNVQRRWILWSAKEAAYKASRRESGGVRFSPANFVADLDHSLRGSVRSGNRRWPVRVRIDGDCVHAVVSENESFADILASSRRITLAESRDPSQVARRFAIASIAARLGVSTSDLGIEKTNRIPQLIVAGEIEPAALSLSHHGSYVGFACCVPRIEKARRVMRRAAAGETVPALLAASRPASDPGCAKRPVAPPSGLQ